MSHSVEDLSKIGIQQWEYFDDAFLGANLLLGNGFSISLCDRLSYKSLFRDFLNNCDPDLKKIFDSFGTSNFELILQILNNANTVNQLLDIENDKIEPIRQNLQEGLIKTIQLNHPTNAEISYPQLRRIADDLLDFKNIYTTNYDVYLYKSILEIIAETKHIQGSPPFQDYFYKERNPSELTFHRQKPYEESRSIYYLHGSLFIYQSENNVSTYKLKKLDPHGLEYVKLIGKEIRNNNFPIFVAEGNYQDKLSMIRNNDYLNFCSNQLQLSRGNLVVYGFSFGDSDTHISEMINSSKIERVAVSIHVGDKSLDQLEKQVSYFNTILTNKSVVVFDSNNIFESLRPY